MNSRERTINLILDTHRDSLFVACNGKIGRELFDLRTSRGEPHDDFILVGAMGCALAFALGVAKHTDKKIVLLLGDGNFLMKMGTLATWKKMLPRNLLVYILNNDAHDSTGGQPTAFSEIKTFLPLNAYFRVLQVLPGARADLGRPTIPAAEITKRFRKRLNA